MTVEHQVDAWSYGRHFVFSAWGQSRVSGVEKEGHSQFSLKFVKRSVRMPVEIQCSRSLKCFFAAQRGREGLYNKLDERAKTTAGNEKNDDGAFMFDSR